MSWKAPSGQLYINKQCFWDGFLNIGLLWKNVWRQHVAICNGKLFILLSFSSRVYASWCFPSLYLSMTPPTHTHTHTTPWPYFLSFLNSFPLPVFILQDPVVQFACQQDVAGIGSIWKDVYGHYESFLLFLNTSPSLQEGLYFNRWIKQSLL